MGAGKNPKPAAKAQRGQGSRAKKADGNQAAPAGGEQVLQQKETSQQAPVTSSTPNTSTSTDSATTGGATGPSDGRQILVAEPQLAKLLVNELATEGTQVVVIGAGTAGLPDLANKHVIVDLDELNADLGRTGLEHGLQTGPAAGESSQTTARGTAGAEQSSAGAPMSKSTPGLAVTSSRDGFWRAGRQWTKDEQRVPLSALTPDQVKLLREEPMLTVVDVDDIPTEGA